MRDLRYAIRVLRRSPGFASMAILSLALGIGANTAIFNVSRALLFEPLAVAHPDRLFAVVNQLTIPRGMGGMSQINGNDYRDAATGRRYRGAMLYPSYRAVRQAAGRDADVFGFSFLRQANISIGGASGVAMTGAGALVSGNYFRGSGAAIVLGRALTEDDDRPGASTAVISHRFWTSAMGADPAAIGKAIRLNGVTFTIVGVSGPGFLGMSRGGFFPPMDVSVPLHAQTAVAPDWTRDRESLVDSDRVFWIHVMARPADGVTPEMLEGKLAGAYAQSLRASSVPGYQHATGVELRLLPGGRGVDGFPRSEEPLRILTGVVVIGLLLACVNLANLMLARGVARRKETSIRLALGSGRFRLLRQAFVESLLLSVAGGALGVFIGVEGGRALLLMLTANAGPVAISIDPNWRMLAFTGGASCVATILFGVLPALRLLRGDVAPSLRATTAAGTGTPRLKAGALLMTIQVAISVPLVAGAAIFLKTVSNLGRVDLGFNPDRLVTFRIEPALSGYDKERIDRTYAQMLDGVRSVPGVSSATLVGQPLLSGISSNTTVTREDGSKLELYYNPIGPDYFATLGIPVLAGRGIDARDAAGAPRVVVFNESAARALFGAVSAIGRRFRPFGDEVEIVGVARDTKYDSLRKANVPTMFLPYPQLKGLLVRSMYVVARTNGAPVAVMGPIGRAAADVDRNVPISRMKTQAAQIEETLGAEIAFTRVLVAFGAFALFLACIGLHGLIAYSVARRTSEIGLRIALGAGRGSVVWLVLRQAAFAVALGVLAGIPIAIEGGRAVSSLLYGVQPADPVSLCAAMALMIGVTAGAAYVPARRAASLEPLKALRAE